MRRVRRLLVALTSFASAALAPLPATAQAPSVDAFKQAFTRELMALRPTGFTERNVLFETVQPGRPSGDSYPFLVTAVIRDYGPGYPANRYYGQTCVGRMDRWRFEMNRDDFGEWRVQGRMTVTSDGARQCVDNPSAGASSQPLATLPGQPAGGGDQSVPVTRTVTPAATANAPSIGEWACYGTGGRRLLGFTLQRGGAYLDGDGARAGTWVHDASAGTVTFRGGAMDGQVGRNARANAFVLSRTVSCEPWR
ncbi:MAG: hypothetical protein ACXWZS_02660 [Gemmatirosa sp.]